MADYWGYQAMARSTATGYFRTEKRGKRWHLITPDGYPYFQKGVYGIVMDDHTVPGQTYTNRQKLLSKYGTFTVWANQVSKRMREWGLNCAADYSIDVITGGMDATLQVPWVDYPLQLANYVFRDPFNWWFNPDDRVKEIQRPCDHNGMIPAGILDAKTFPDLWDPKWDQAIRLRLGGAGTGNAYSLGNSFDDGDYISSLFGGTDIDIPFSDGIDRSGPHGGLIALCTPPTQTTSVNDAGLYDPNPFTYADTTTYTKNALRDYLIGVYGTIGALNSTWGSNYTTFQSAGGYPTGTGLLDESGRQGGGLWLGPKDDATKNWKSLNGAIGAVKADLDQFLFLMAQRYCQSYVTAMNTVGRKIMALGPTSFGSWGNPPHRKVLQAVGQTLPVLRIAINIDTTRLDYVLLHAGDVPLILWVGSTADQDSMLWRNGNTGNYSTQIARGQAFYTAVVDMMNVAASDGTKPVVGYQWFAWNDVTIENPGNWGLVTLSDNAYDSYEGEVNTGTDKWGYTTGGEERDFGDFLGHMRRANDFIDFTLVSEDRGLRVTQA